MLNNLIGVTYLEIEEVNHRSLTEPHESYYRCNITKDGVKAKGLGKTANQSFNDAIAQVRSYNLKTESIIKELGNEFPF